MYPYFMGLARVPVEVEGWRVTDSGIQGHGETGSFSHSLDDGTVGWSRLTVDAFNGAVVTQYQGFYVDMAWPEFHLKGGNVTLAYSPGSQAEFNVGLASLSPVEERYGNMDMAVTPRAFVHNSKGWGVLADAVFNFRDEEGGTFAQGVAVDHLFLSMASEADCGQPSIPLNIKGEVGGADELVTSLDVSPTQGDVKLAFDFSSELSIEGLGKAEKPVHILYWIKKPVGGRPILWGPVILPR